MKKITLFFLIFGFSLQTFAESPRFCKKQDLLQSEVRVTDNRIVRAHVFHLPEAVLVGAAIGRSDAHSMEKLAVDSARVTAQDKYCTFYLNTGNKVAGQDFYQKTLDAPGGKPNMVIAQRFEAQLNPLYGPMAECLANNHYLAMGCNAMEHRGPSAFAAFLAFAGCEPNDAVDSAIALWGDNGISREMRMMIAQIAFNRGSQQPQVRAKLQQIFE